MWKKIRTAMGSKLKSDYVWMRIEWKISYPLYFCSHLIIYLITPLLPPSPLLPLLIAFNRTWSIAHGIKQGMSRAPLKGMWNVLGNAGQACTAGNAVLPILSEPPNPNIAFTFQKKWKVKHKMRNYKICCMKKWNQNEWT